MSRAAPKLPPHELAALWAEYGCTRSETARNRLVELHLHMVPIVAYKMMKRLPQEVDENDLIQWGLMGLMQAVEKFEPERGWKFTTYAAQRIKGEMLDGLRNVARVNRGSLDLVRELNEAEETLACKLDRQPTPDEVISTMGITPSRLRHLNTLRTIMQGISLNRPWNLLSSHARDGFHADFIADERQVNPLMQAERKEMFDSIIEYMLREFRLTEVLVVRLYHVEDLSFAKIAPILGLSDCRICQLHGLAMKRLKARFAAVA